MKVSKIPFLKLISLCSYLTSYFSLCIYSNQEVLLFVLFILFVYCSFPVYNFCYHYTANLHCDSYLLRFGISFPQSIRITI